MSKNKMALIKKIKEADYDPILELACRLYKQNKMTSEDVHKLLKCTEYSFSSPIGNKIIHKIRDLERIDRDNGEI